MKKRRIMILSFFIWSIFCTSQAIIYDYYPMTLNLEEVSMSLNGGNQTAESQTANIDNNLSTFLLMPLIGIFFTTIIIFKNMDINLCTIKHTSKTRNSAYYFILLTRTKDMLNKAMLISPEVGCSHYELFNLPHKESY